MEILLPMIWFLLGDHFVDGVVVISVSWLVLKSILFGNILVETDVVGCVPTSVVILVITLPLPHLFSL